MTARQPPSVGAALSGLGAPLAASAAMVWLTGRIDLATVPREIEAAAIIGIGGLAWILLRTAFRLLSVRPDPMAIALARAGADNDHGARRVLDLVGDARDRLSRMRAAAAGLPDPVAPAYVAFEGTVESFLADLETTPDAGLRGKDVLRRLLPRMESAFLEYAEFETRAAEIAAPDTERARIAAALSRAGAAARAAREDLLSQDAAAVDVELSVLEDTLDRTRS